MPIQRWREARLLSRLRNGDRSAGAEIVEAYYDDAFQWLAHLCGDRDRAADMTQDTFLQVWKGLDGFRSESSLRTWILHIAYYTYQRAMKQQGPVAAVNESASDCTDVESTVLDRRVVNDALLALGPEQRQVVLLHYFYGLKCREIAQVLEVPLGTVLSRLHAGRAYLRQLLRAEYGTPEPEADPGDRPVKGKTSRGCSDYSGARRRQIWRHVYWKTWSAHSKGRCPKRLAREDDGGWSWLGSVLSA